jgi:choice-of-anchor B domain-containing protein
VRTGTSIIDITENPGVRELTFIPSPASAWKDLKTYRHFAYVVTEATGGLQIIDLSSLPDSARLVATVPGLSPSHNISIDTARALLHLEYNDSQPVRVFSLTDPENPTEVSFYGSDAHDIFARNGIAYISEGHLGTVGIFDLTSPETPALLTRFALPSSGFVHNAWPTEDDQFLMTTEETRDKSVKMWDLRDPDTIRMTDEYRIPSTTAHNVHIKGRFAYISYYTEGLRVVDISNPDSIFEAGYYDTFSGPSGEANGAWGTFPFFPSGKILISDIESGLYVVRFNAIPTTVAQISHVSREYSLLQNFPNPFNPETMVTFTLPEETSVNISVYTLLGQRVRTLVEGTLTAGTHRVKWDGMNVSGSSAAGGVYLYRIEAGQFIKTMKMTLLR